MYIVTGFNKSGEITYWKKVQYVPDIQLQVTKAFGEFFSTKVEVTKED